MAGKYITSSKRSDLILPDQIRRPLLGKTGHMPTVKITHRKRKRNQKQKKIRRGRPSRLIGLTPVMDPRVTATHMRESFVTVHLDPIRRVTAMAAQFLQPENCGFDGAVCNAS